MHVKTDGDEIVCTREHPFYVPVRGWAAACDLRAGDILVRSNGEYVVVEAIEHELLESPITVYNFEVEDFHTYYVGDTSVLVHNKCGYDRKISPTRIEQQLNLPEKTFHRVLKPRILKEAPPNIKLVGKNPDILLNKSMDIAYQGAKGVGFQKTGLNLLRMINEMRLS